MSTYLFAVQPARGHLNPLLAIARTMKREGTHHRRQLPVLGYPFSAAERLNEHLVQTGEPLARPEGYPLTVNRGGTLPWEVGTAGS